MQRWLSALLACLVWCLPASGVAQLANNHYVIDLFTGPVIGPSRIVGMGGAHAAIASGIDGSFYNPAGYAERVEKENRFGVFDITGGLLLSGFFQRSDVQNNGKSGLNGIDAIQMMLGTRVQIAYAGAGVSALARIYTLTDKNNKPYADVNIVTVRAGTGYAFLDGDLVVGTALSHISFNLSKPDGGKSLVTFSGYGAEFGGLYRPKHRRHRIGAAFRTPISSQPQDDAQQSGGVRRVEGLVLPASVHVPWEVDLGFAYQFGERRANVPWRSTHQLRRELTAQIMSGSYRTPSAYGGAPYAPLPGQVEAAVEQAIENYRQAEWRYRRRQPRRYVLLAADVLLYGPTAQGQSVSAFLLQSPERSGAKLSYGARVGVESEIWQDRMKVRAGSYLEPSRIARRYYRPHATLGMDVRLFDFWRWSARGTATLDVAPRYFNWGLALGMWW